MVVKWKDGNTSSVPLHAMKESEPLATAEYAVAAQGEDWPEFASWVRPVLNRRKQIIAKVASRRFLNTKFGLPLPMTAEQAQMWVCSRLTLCSWGPKLFFTVKYEILVKLQHYNTTF